MKGDDTTAEGPDDVKGDDTTGGEDTTPEP